MSHNGCHRLPGFAHFESSLSSLSSSLEPLELGTGLDLTIVTGLDLTSTNYEGLNLSNNGGGGGGREPPQIQQHQGAQATQVVNKQQQQQALPQLVFNQSQLSQHQSQQQHQHNQQQQQQQMNQHQLQQPEMVLNLSTQIGLNLTRPGQTELDYTNMLDIDQDNTFTTSLQGNEFEYYGNYYETYAPQNSASILEDQRSSPLNLEHRSSPLNLTAVGNLTRKRKSTSGQTMQVTPVIPVISSSAVMTGNSFNSNQQAYNFTYSVTQQQQHRQQPSQGKLSNNSAIGANQAKPVPLVGKGRGKQLGDAPAGGMKVDMPPSTTSTFVIANSIVSSQHPVAGTSQTMPLNMGKLANYQQMTQNSDYGYSNQAYDYRLPTKLTSFYNQQEAALEQSESKPALGSPVNASTPVPSAAGYTQQSKDVFNLSFGYYDNFAAAGSSLDQYSNSANPDDYTLAIFSSNNKENDKDKTEVNYSNIKNTPVNNLFINYDGAQEAVESKPKTGPVIKCDTFKAELNSLEELEVHKATPCLSFFCVDCKKAFAEESQLFSHNKMMHAARTKGPEAMNMVKPGKQSAKGSSRPPTKRDRRPTPDLAKLKEALANQPFPYQCRHCNDKFSLREELLAHLAEHNNSKPFKCSICGQGFGLQSSVKRHEKTHAMKKPNVCAQCDKKFARKSDLVNHMKVHLKSESKISCHHCAAIFHSEREATRHNCSARSKTGPEYPCPVCQYILKTKVEWGVHMWKHTSNARYIVINEEAELPDYVSESPRSILGC